MKYCLIGEKLGHSYSEEIHRYSGLDYSLVELQQDQIESFLKSGYDGFNVTIPYKKQIIPFLDFISDEVKEIGSVNTVLVKDGKRYGYNTDIFGMEYSLKRAEINIKDKSVLILGSGGTSLTAQTLCKKLKAKEIVVLSRTGEVNYQNYQTLKQIQVIINTTPVGMFPKDCDCPIDITVFPLLEGVFDCIYNPIRTNLVISAEKLGIKTTGGISMLVAQALKAQEIWTGKEFSDEKFDLALKNLLKEKRNIVFIGMPSCGKTTVANALSKVTGKEVVDTDNIVTLSNGKTPSQIIEECGEQFFRDRESEAVKTACGKVGVIIATGGGAILRRENVETLKKNGVLIYLERDIEKLIDFDRPLSKNGAISRLFEQRRPIYEAVCDKKVSNDGCLGETVKEILKI